MPSSLQFSTWHFHYSDADHDSDYDRHESDYDRHHDSDYDNLDADQVYLDFAQNHDDDEGDLWVFTQPGLLIVAGRD